MFEDLETLPENIKTKGDSTGNGQYFIEKCMKCFGTGRFRSYSGRDLGECFSCKGEGKRQYKTSPEQRAKGRASAAKSKEKKANQIAEKGQQFLEQHALVGWINETKEWNNFARSMHQAALKWGKLTDGQLAAALKSKAKHDEKQAAFKKHEAESAVALDGEGLARIQKAFDDAKGNGLKKPKMRVVGLVLSLAPAHGKNAGAVYVKSSASFGDHLPTDEYIHADEYLGKITPEGNYQPPFKLKDVFKEEAARILKEVAQDPLAEAVAYGRKTGSCACCGRELTNAESIERGIGPICAEKWCL